ncbi:MAG: WD40 repeat domain-containing protein [Polyangiaceae bacterium]
MRWLRVGLAGVALACATPAGAPAPAPRTIVASAEPAPSADPPAAAPAPALEPALVPQTGHVSQVWSVAFHPKAPILATGGFDHTIGLWRLEGGLLAELVGHHEAVTRVAWSEAGDVLASIARDGRIIVWDLARFVPKLVIEHRGFDIALDPEGASIYVVGPGAELSRYDARTGKLLSSARTPANEGRQLLGVTRSLDGTRLATTSLEGSVHVWDASLRLLASSRQRATGAAFGSDGKSLLVPSGNDLSLLDAESGRVLRTIPVGAKVSKVSVTRDGARAVVSAGDRIVLVDLALGKVAGRFSMGYVEAFALSPDGESLATGNDDPQVRLWRARDGAPLRAFGNPWGEVSGATFDPKGDRIATRAAAWVDVWDAREGTLLRRLDTGGRAPGQPIWSPDGSLVAASVGPGKARVWDAALGKELGTVGVPTRDDWGARLAFAPDSSGLFVFTDQHALYWDRAGRKVKKNISRKLTLVTDVDWRGTTLAAGGSEGVDLFDPKNWSVRHLDTKPLVPWGRTEALALSPDGTRFVTASSQFIGLWDVASGTLLGKTETRAFFASPVWSPGGQKIAFPSRRQGVSLWDGRGAPKEIAVSHGPVRQIRFSPDGRSLAVASDDSMLRIFDVATGRLAQTLSGHEARIWSLEWHPSGRVLLSASHQARLHRVDGASLALRALASAPRGVVHSSTHYFGSAEELLALRTAQPLSEASLGAPASRRDAELLSKFWSLP